MVTKEFAKQFQETVANITTFLILLVSFHLALYGALHYNENKPAEQPKRIIEYIPSPGNRLVPEIKNYEVLEEPVFEPFNINNPIFIIAYSNIDKLNGIVTDMFYSTGENVTITIDRENLSAYLWNNGWLKLNTEYKKNLTIECPIQGIIVLVEENV